MSKGAFFLWPLDKENKLIDFDPANLTKPADPSNRDAVDIYFGVVPGDSPPGSPPPGSPPPTPPPPPEPPPKDQIELVEKIQKVLRTIQLLYRPSEPVSGDAVQAEEHRRRFRYYYVRLFWLGQVGVQGSNASPELASVSLASAIADLIDDEAGNVKRTHMRALAVNGMKFSAVCGAAYVLLKLIANYWPPVDHFLAGMGVQSVLLAHFMLLLIGSFLGVWLSYAIRTATFTLSDLTVTDADRLTPHVRLLYAGALTVILGIVFVIPLLELKVGSIPITDISSKPMFAFVVGCFCGISELTLPSVVAKRASDFIQNIK